jgi:prepilin signal peptidase PulO-like enzyme (type II secretory pathway)
MPATLFFYIFFFIFGTIVGSFLNVVVLRYNTGVSIARGRSFCFSCGKKLSWSELVPVLSFVFQRRRCRGCKSKISWQYPVVELLTGLLFAGVFWKYGLAGLLSNLPAIIISLILMALFVAITVYDIKHKIIPDGLIIAFGVVSLVNIFSTIHAHFLWPLLAGPILALPLFLIWLFSKGRLMGLGDPKLVLCIGWFLGLRLGLTAVILAFWSGALYGLVLMALSHFKWHGLNISRKSELPFAPFLILGFLLVFFFNLNLLHVIM